ncbi:hypothetical protein AVEN_271138-1 [Araneus ventricosus]|uniref:Uncharacterized protein n=1 Tax=Araneus ventricosus TaxID=182803 RepID=A0A4Y2E6X6_ARAVE|nr:hypothetical protein AVEN_271138-1 [Araneus ventricosus]
MEKGCWHFLLGTEKPCPEGESDQDKTYGSRTEMDPGVRRVKNPSSNFSTVKHPDTSLSSDSGSRSEESSNQDEVYETLEYECYNSELPRKLKNALSSFCVLCYLCLLKGSKCLAPIWKRK